MNTKLKIYAGMLFLITSNAMAQTPDFSKVSSKNTWFKVGVNAGVPLSPTTSSFVLGLDASLQFLEVKESGIGIKTGYSNYFSSDSNIGDFGEFPVAIMYRFYPTSSGFFTGIDMGYSFIINSSSSTGGFMTRPQAGYHGYNWNIFAYYNIVFAEESIQSIGVSVTRNIRLSGK